MTHLVPPNRRRKKSVYSQFLSTVEASALQYKAQAKNIGKNTDKFHSVKMENATAVIQKAKLLH